MTNRPIRHDGSAVGGSLQLRVLTRERELIGGRIQSEPGRETLDQLAAGCIETLRKKGVLQ